MSIELVKSLYPECMQREPWEDDDDPIYFKSPTDYQPLLTSFGYEILLQVDDQGYSGDSRLLYRSRSSDGKERFGILIFGWGSCSGCDALQACDSYEDIERLRANTGNQIRWFDSAEEALEWVRFHDWEGDYGYRTEEQQEFIRRIQEILGSVT